MTDGAPSSVRSVRRYTDSMPRCLERSTLQNMPFAIVVHHNRAEAQAVIDAIGLDGVAVCHIVTPPPPSLELSNEATTAAALDGPFQSLRRLNEASGQTKVPRIHVFPARKVFDDVTSSEGKNAILTSLMAEGPPRWSSGTLQSLTNTLWPSVALAQQQVGSSLGNAPAIIATSASSSYSAAAAMTVPPRAVAAPSSPPSTSVAPSTTNSDTPPPAVRLPASSSAPVVVEKARHSHVDPTGGSTGVAGAPPIGLTDSETTRRKGSGEEAILAGTPSLPALVASSVSPSVTSAAPSPPVEIPHSTLQPVAATHDDFVRVKLQYADGASDVLQLAPTALISSVERVAEGRMGNSAFVLIAIPGGRLRDSNATLNSLKLTGSVLIRVVANSGDHTLGSESARPPPHRSGEEVPSPPPPPSSTPSGGVMTRIANIFWGGASSSASSSGPPPPSAPQQAQSLRPGPAAAAVAPAGRMRSMAEMRQEEAQAAAASSASRPNTFFGGQSTAFMARKAGDDDNDSGGQK